MVMVQIVSPVSTWMKKDCLCTGHTHNKDHLSLADPDVTKGEGDKFIPGCTVYGNDALLPPPLPLLKLLPHPSCRPKAPSEKRVNFKVIFFDTRKSIKSQGREVVNQRRQFHLIVFIGQTVSFLDLLVLVKENPCCFFFFPSFYQVLK